MKRQLATAVTLTVLASSVSFINVFADDKIKEVVSSNLSVERFGLSDSKNLNSYDETFKVKVKSISNNGGNYGSSMIDLATDGKLGTHWETGRPNSGEHINEVVLELHEQTNINRIVYASRQDAGAKGFAENLKVFVSPTGKDSDYKLVGNGVYSRTSDLMEYKFNSISAKKVKLVFDKVSEDWASASEVWIYKEDTTLDKINNIFTDGTYSELKPNINSRDLRKLEDSLKTHPLRKELKSDLELAKEVLKYPEKYASQVLDVKAEGNTNEETSKRGLWYFKNWQPTGLAVKSGDKIEVFVDVQEGGKIPNVIFKQSDTQDNGDHYFHLKPGKNIIEIPKLGKTMRPGISNAGVLYVENSASNERTARVRINGGFEYPHYKESMTDKQVMETLESYVCKLKADPTLPDVFEVFSKYTVNNVRATFALDYYKNNKEYSPSITAEKQDYLITSAINYWGFDSSSELNTMPKFRYVNMLKYLDGGGFMNAGNGVTGINQAEQYAILIAETSWGVVHELGHNFDLNKISIGEVTNNMLSQHIMKKEGKPSRITEDKVWENTIFPKVSSRDYSGNTPYPAEDSYSLSHLAPLWQLELIKEDFHSEFQKLVREDKGDYPSENDKHNAWARFASDVMQMDLTEFVSRHGWKLTNETKSYMDKYKMPDKKIWYMNDNSYTKDGGEFTSVLEYRINSIKQTGNEVKLTMEIDKENEKNLMGYEVLRDGEVIGFTHKNTFVDKNAVEGKDYVYSIVAYDLELNASGKADAESNSPIISGGKYTVKLGSSINPLDYVVAVDSKGNGITSKVSLLSGNINASKKGTYKLEYEIEDKGIKRRATSLVTVVGDITYLSDMKELSSKVGWGEFRKDLAPNETVLELQRDNIIIPFKKGIGAHANSEVVYNLEGRNYKTFESYIGIDSSMLDNDGSATFEVHVDGTRVFDSGRITPTIEGNLIRIDINGAKELKLITTDANHNGNNADQTIWADAKLIVESDNPVLEVPKAKLVKVSSDFNILDGVVATDTEDGDISSNVKVEGNFDINTPGIYNITYSIKDSDGNKVSKDARVQVYGSEEFASDLDFEIVRQAWGGIQKDLSPAKDSISLPSSNGEVIFNKGIGACANSELVFNIEGKNFTGFKSMLGIDKHERGNSNVSAKYIIEIDGSRVYESDTFRHDTNLQEVNILIPSDAKEVKLITDQADHIDWGDQTVWADAMFVTN